MKAGLGRSVRIHRIHQSHSPPARSAASIFGTAAKAENPRARLAAELLGNAAYVGTAERVAAFVAQGGGCQATFFDYRRYLLK